MRRKQASNLSIILPMILCVLLLLGFYQYNSYFTLVRTPVEGSALFSLHDGAVRSIAFQTGDGERVELTEEEEVLEAVQAMNSLLCGEITPDQPASGGYDRAVLVEMVNGTTQIFSYSDGYVDIYTSSETYSRCACDTSALDVFFQRAGIEV